MKSISLALALVAALPLSAAANTSVEDVKKLAQAGVSDDVILAFIRANGTIAQLSSDAVVDLKAAGVSDRVLNALLTPAPKVEETPRTEYVEAPRTTETRVVERNVYVPSTTYVYSEPYYPSSYYYSSYYYPSYSYSSCSPSYYRSYSPSISIGYSYHRGYRGYYYGSGWCW